ncbi:MAG: hypothetical protein HY811_04250 [Planctomycetes bacterium]|nr:hypothetical protein [Planctomycetota bacterium]
MDKPERAIELFKLHQKIVSFVDNNIVKFPDNPGLKDACCILLFSKSTKTFRAIQCLCNPVDMGYGEDAIILVRSLLENLMSLAYIVKPQNEEEQNRRAELFKNWLILDLYNFKKELKECSSMKTRLNQEIEQIDPAGDRYCEADRLFNEEIKKLKQNGYKTNKYSWSGLSLKWMAEEVGLLELYYKIVYWHYSQLVHPHPGCIDSYITQLPDSNINICDMPDSSWIEDALFSSFDCYRQIARLINDTFSFNLGGKLDEIENEFKSLVEKLIC